ncbi:MAG: succinate dehydrogenase cytochrome b subunit [Deltaproteobacteria bacterium]|nr:succinate dehydrogenase cytochrome b subunit [Deltaproteobacteria bacterium]
MKRLLALLSSDIGRKALMGLTGLLLIGFLIAHMSANLLVPFSKEGYNEYSHKLITNPLIYLAELGLLVFFAGHFVTGIVVTLKNWGARPIAYQRKDPAGDPSRKSLASSTMIYSGLVLLVFVPLHLVTFKFGPWYLTPDGSMRDIHRLTIEVFHSPINLAWYLIALPILGFHAWHGFGSGFESLGVAHSAGLRRFGQGLAVVLTLGFMAVPLYVLLGGGAS